MQRRRTREVSRSCPQSYTTRLWRPSRCLTTRTTKQFVTIRNVPNDQLTFWGGCPGDRDNCEESGPLPQWEPAAGGHRGDGGHGADGIHPPGQVPARHIQVGNDGPKKGPSSSILPYYNLPKGSFSNKSSSLHHTRNFWQPSEPWTQRTRGTWTRRSSPCCSQRRGRPSVRRRWQSSAAPPWTRSPSLSTTRSMSTSSGLMTTSEMISDQGTIKINVLLAVL